MTAANTDLAAAARRLADDLMSARRAALVAAVALDESRSLEQARRICSGMTDPALAAGALAVVDGLAAEPPVGAALIRSRRTASAQ
jgi:hypothetical protein